MTNHTTVIDTPEGIDRFRLVALRGALRIEVRTGMKAHRGVNVLKVAEEYLGYRPRTKAAALEAIEALIDG